jgi:hypothetical protein
MNHATQLACRIASPIIISGIFMILIFSHSLSEAWIAISKDGVELLKFTLLNGLLIGFGLMVHKIIRPIFVDSLWAEVDFKVKQNLVKSANLADPDAAKLLNSKKGLIRIFFKIIDSDPSLTKTSEKVLLNGTVITTLYDLLLVSNLAIVVLTIKLFSEFDPSGWQITLWILILVLIIFTPKLIEKFKLTHIQMGSEQIDEIRRHHYGTLQKFTDELLNDLDK